MMPERVQSDSNVNSNSHVVQGNAEEETGLTLRRLDVWINEWRLRMRMMSICVEGARGISQLSQS
jgi:gamma-tubulin complex component 3